MRCGDRRSLRIQQFCCVVLLVRERSAPVHIVWADSDRGCDESIMTWRRPWASSTGYIEFIKKTEHRATQNTDKYSPSGVPLVELLVHSCVPCKR